MLRFGIVAKRDLCITFNMLGVFIMFFLLVVYLTCGVITTMVTGVRAYLYFRYEDGHYKVSGGVKENIVCASCGCVSGIFQGVLFPYIWYQYIKSWLRKDDKE